MKNTDDYLLTSSITVGDLKRWINTKDADAKQNISSLIYHRFYNRYIKHVKQLDSGFLIMAISCLMIEAMESFRQGKNNTRLKSKITFEEFFENQHENFPGLAEIGSEFYEDIRCGILHQAETTKGWRILRKGPLLNKEGKSINALAFIRALNTALNDYIDELKHSEFDTDIWKKALIKLEFICKNCELD